MEETAVEPQELHDTPSNRIDPQQGTISITGVKQHLNGVYKLSEKTANDLRLYLAKQNTQYPFPTARHLGSEWTRIKQRRAKELNKPELLKIQLKSLRNYAGAVYYLTMGKDPIATRNFMRHRRLEQTMDYLRGITEFSATRTRITKLVNTPEEAIELINQGFKEETIFYQGTPNEKHILSKINL